MAGKTTESEVSELANKLDADIDNFMDELARRPHRDLYKDGFSVDNWEEEMEKIPFFMTQEPGCVDCEQSPAMAALQALKYEDQDVNGRALSYKEEGNDLFKKKDYRGAVLSYTEALRGDGPTDKSIACVLHNNRASANFHLENFRSSYNDARCAIKIDPRHMKALVRVATCCQKLKLNDEAVCWCDFGLKINDTDKSLLGIRKMASTKKRQQNRDECRAKKNELKEDVKKNMLLKSIMERGIKLKGDILSLEKLEGCNPTGASVNIDENGELRWPVLFLYPEHNQSDYISQFHENTRFMDHLKIMFPEDSVGQSPPWDSEHKYKSDNLSIFFEVKSTMKLHKIDTGSTLLQVLQQPGYLITAGTPNFFILVKRSKFYNHFINKYN